MKLIPGIVALKNEFIKIRHYLHAHPETGFKEFETSKFVREKLKEYGYEVSSKSYGVTGLVGQLKKGNSKKVIGFRADMDALPMQENTGLPYASKNDGAMHACGHDGHTTTLLLAAKYLAGTDFNGTINLYFQPAEEHGVGAKRMIEDGALKDYPTDFLFAYHNMPIYFPDNKKFYMRAGGIMASSDGIKTKIIGKGGHSSAPEKAVDPTIAFANALLAVQTIISRETDPRDPVVISCGHVNCGNDLSYNIIAQELTFLLHVRSLKPDVRRNVLERIKSIISEVCASYRCVAEVEVLEACAVTFNEAEATAMGLEAGREIFNEADINTDFLPLMGSEDFGHFGEGANAPKVAYAMINAGGEYFVHNPKYDFNDELLTQAASYFATLAKNYLK